MTTGDEATATGVEGTTGDATDSAGVPGPAEACAAWCAWNVMCSDIPLELCLMMCGDDLEEEVRPGACLDAYVAFYLCVGEQVSCDSAVVEVACAEQQGAIERCG